MKKIRISLIMTVEADVLIDETIINKSAIDGIADHFDGEIYDQPESCEDELSEYECGLYNYARAAAMVGAELGNVEYITLEKGHTSVNIESKYLDSEFDKMETV